MVIDLRADTLDFKNYLSQMVDEHNRKSRPTPGMIHVGFTFDQDGWVSAYLDTRPNANRDGEWTVHLQPETLLPRPRWYEASELNDLGNLILIGHDGSESLKWRQNPTIQNLAWVFGEFLRSSVSTFEVEGLFKSLIGNEKLNYCVEEFTGLYGWPMNPKVVKATQSIKLSGNNTGAHII
jgi:hypothetical protein